MKVNYSLYKIRLVGDNRVIDSMGDTKSRKRKYVRKNKSREGLSAICTNNHSLGNKTNELRAVATTRNPDIMGVGESWMNILEYILEGYKLFDTDRIANSKGGIVVIIICYRKSVN